MSADPAPACRCSAAPALALGLRDAAKSLSVSERTAWQLIKDRRLHCVRVGTRIIVPVREIEAFLEREARTQAAPPPAETPTGTGVRP